MEEAIAHLLAVSSAWAGEASAAPPMEHVVSLARDISSVHWYTWCWAAVVAMLGWFASSAPTLAGWIDDGHDQSPRELWARRWAIVGRLATCLAAGLVAFLGGLLMGTPMVANFIAVLLASYAGDKYLQLQADKVANRPPPGGGP